MSLRTACGVRVLPECSSVLRRLKVAVMVLPGGSGEDRRAVAATLQRRLPAVNPPLRLGSTTLGRRLTLPALRLLLLGRGEQFGGGLSSLVALLRQCSASLAVERDDARTPDDGVHVIPARPAVAVDAACAAFPGPGPPGVGHRSSSPPGQGQRAFPHRRGPAWPAVAFWRLAGWAGVMGEPRPALPTVRRTLRVEAVPILARWRASARVGLRDSDRRASVGRAALPAVVGVPSSRMALISRRRGRPGR